MAWMQDGLPVATPQLRCWDTWFPAGQSAWEGWGSFKRWSLAEKSGPYRVLRFHSSAPTSFSLFPECWCGMSSHLCLFLMSCLPCHGGLHVPLNCEPEQTLPPLSCFCQGMWHSDRKVTKTNSNSGRNLCNLDLVIEVTLYRLLFDCLI